MQAGEQEAFGVLPSEERPIRVRGNRAQALETRVLSVQRARGLHSPALAWSLSLTQQEPVATGFETPTLSSSPDPISTAGLWLIHLGKTPPNSLQLEDNS